MSTAAKITYTIDQALKEAQRSELNFADAMVDGNDERAYEYLKDAAMHYETLAATARKRRREYLDLIAAKQALKEAN